MVDFNAGMTRNSTHVGAMMALTLDAVRADRTRDLRGVVRTRRRRGCRLAASGVGGGSAGRDRASPPEGVHAFVPRRLCPARGGHGGRHHAVHGRGGADTAGNRQRAGVPRAPRRRRPARARPPEVAGAGGRRCRAADTTVGRRSRSRRNPVRPRRGRVLGALHRADPAGGRRGRRHQRARGVDAGRRSGGDRSWAGRRCSGR